MDPSKSIFWGLVVKPGKRYETEVQEPFRITKACLEPASAGGKVSSVFVECDNSEEFIIANLNAKNFNETIDLAFNEGEKICFKVDGPGTVHMTGNLLDDPPTDGMYPGGDSSEEDSGESEEETVEAGEKIEEVSEKEAMKILKRKKEQVKHVKSKKAKVEETDTTVDTSIGDLDDTDNFAEENDSESEDDEDDGDTESDSDEENTTVGDTTTEMADTTAASDDDSDSSEEEDAEGEEEEEQMVLPVSKVETPTKTKEVDVRVVLDADVKTPKDKKKEKANKVIETPKIKEADVKVNKTLNQEVTEKKLSETPKTEPKTPKIELKTPKQDAKTPKESKTPKQEVKTPKLESKTPKEEAKTPKQNAKAPKEESKTPKQDRKTPKDAQTPGKTPKRTLKGGVVAEDIIEGTGPECKPGNMVGMYYEGRLKSTNKKFDGLQSGKPFKFKLGSGQVIKGWDVGVLGMKVGGKRKLIIPPQLGYGAQGAAPDIPPNATLVFDIECKLVK